MPGPLPSPTSADTPSASALEREIHAQINRHRAARGLAPLAYEEGIAGVARRHSQAMASGERGFGHDGFQGRSTAIAQLFPIGAMAENVAYDGRTGPRLAELVVAGWLASADHRRNIEGAYQLTGIGVARAPDGIRYFTQIFVTRR